MAKSHQVLASRQTGSSAPGHEDIQPLATSAWFALTEEQKQVALKITEIAESGIRSRADRYDADAAMPIADIEELHKGGWLTVSLDERNGGRGYGIHGRDPLSFYLITENLAKVSPATAHCVQVHNGTSQILQAFAEPAQLEEFMRPTVEKGLLLVGAGSEPGGGRQGTVARRVPGGFLVTGQKHYATNAMYCEWIWVLARSQDAGEDIMLMVNRNSDGLIVESSFWDPVGMRACVSPMLTFKDCFVPERNVLGAAGGFFREKWLAKINMGFSANYLGALQGMYGWLIQYLRGRPTKSDPVYQTSIGELKAKIDAVRLMLYTAVLRTRENMEQGLLMSNEAKWLAVDALETMMRIGNQAAGSTGLFRKYPYQRLMRDAQVHLLHRRHHVGAQIVGRSELGELYDLNQS